MVGNFSNRSGLKPHEGQHRIPRGHHQAGSFAGKGRKGLRKIANQPILVGREAIARIERVRFVEQNPEFSDFTTEFPEVGFGGGDFDEPPTGGIDLGGGGGFLPNISIEMLDPDIEGKIGLRITADETSREVKDIVERLTKFAKRRARMHAPMGETGNLRRSIDATPVSSFGGAMRAEITADASYAKGVEEGTPEQDGSPGNLIKIAKKGEKPKAVRHRKASVGRFFMRKAFEETSAEADVELAKFKLDH